jgi:3-phenylpropionate/trans-cinnamate dioxygenase ferredoxin reductase subunit
VADSKTFVIVGGGLGGAKAAEALREKGFDGKVVLLADEEYLPYERPPLSKEFLAGKKSLADFTVHDSEWYRDNKIDLRVGTEAVAIDRKAHTVALDDGNDLRYDKLLLATGSRARWLSIPGSITCGNSAMRKTWIPRSRMALRSQSSGPAGSGWRSRQVPANAVSTSPWWRPPRLR